MGAGAVAVIYILSVWGSKSFWKYHGLGGSVTNREGSAIFSHISHNHTVRWGKVTQCLRTGVQENISVFLHKKSSVRLGVVRVCNTSHFIFPMSHTCSSFATGTVTNAQQQNTEIQFFSGACSASCFSPLRKLVLQWIEDPLFSRAVLSCNNRRSQ